VEGVDWIHLVQDMVLRRVFVNMDMNFRVPLKAEKFLTT
jgi:hypothetical protein